MASPVNSVSCSTAFFMATHTPFTPGSASRPPWSWRVVLTLLMVSMMFGDAVQRTTAGEAEPPSPVPTNCTWTFTQMDELYRMVMYDSNVTVPIIAYQPLAATCPPGCLQQRSTDPSLLRVFGSFPYHGSSSICLAAIHSGIINETTGGGAFISRFYRSNWSQSPTQTIFPFTSAEGTASNGVTSELVDPSWYSVPSDGTMFSYVVRGRGDFVVQRRTAPFPPRAGHLHQLWQLKRIEWFAPAVSVDYELSNPLNRTYTVHLIVGGFNNTHYLNDVSVHSLQSTALAPTLAGFNH